MKRKYLFLALALTLSLGACSADQPPQGSADAQPTPPTSEELRQDDPLSGTYWTAVRREQTNEQTGATESSTMPTEQWWADLWLNEDGSAQYREVLNCFYNADIHGGKWWQGMDGSIRLTAPDAASYLPYIDGRLENGQLVLEYFGQRFYLEQAEPPAPGGELCAADAQGTWKLSRILRGGAESDARAEGMAACLQLDERWSDWSLGYIPTASFYSASALDSAPQYRQHSAMSVEVLPSAAIDGLSNQCWSLRLSDGEARLLLSMTDMDTIYLADESGTIGIYERRASLLPDTVTAALRELDFNALIFYWPEPDAATSAELDFVPVTEAEPGGSDRILLVSRWIDLQLQLHSGVPQLNEDGSLYSWVSSGIIYEGELDADEPMWLSLDLPEGDAEFCLYFKLPGSEIWSCWPLTQQGAFRIDGYTAFTAG